MFSVASHCIELQLSRPQDRAQQTVSAHWISKIKGLVLSTAPSCELLIAQPIKDLRFRGLQPERAEWLYNLLKVLHSGAQAVQGLQ